MLRQPSLHASAAYAGSCCERREFNQNYLHGYLIEGIFFGPPSGKSSIL